MNYFRITRGYVTTWLDYAVIISEGFIRLLEGIVRIYDAVKGWSQCENFKVGFVA